MSAFKWEATCSILAIAIQSERVQEVEERGDHLSLPIMYGFDKGDIPLTYVVRHHHMVYHQGLLKTGNTI
jgi:hypothetical protein